MTLLSLTAVLLLLGADAGPLKPAPGGEYARILSRDHPASPSGKHVHFLK